MEPIKFQTAYEYDAMNWVHVFHMRMPINGNMVYAKTKVTEQMLDYDRKLAIEQVKWELAAGIASEIRKQAEQFLALVDLMAPPTPTPKSNYSADYILKHVYERQLAQQLDDKALEKLKAQFMAPPKDTYKDKATSEFEGVEGLDESLWKDGTDGLI